MDAKRTSVEANGPRGPLDDLRHALESGRYEVPTEEVAEALIRLHAGFGVGRLPHEVAPSL